MQTMRQVLYRFVIMSLQYITFSDVCALRNDFPLASERDFIRNGQIKKGAKIYQPISTH